MQEALNVKPNTTFVGCSDKVASVLGPDVMKSVKPLIPDLLAALPVLLYQGQSGSLHVVQSVTSLLAPHVIRTMKAIILDSMAILPVLLCQWSVWQSLCGLHQACWMPVLRLGNACISNDTSRWHTGVLQLVSSSHLSV